MIHAAQRHAAPDHRAYRRPRRVLTAAAVGAVLLTGGVVATQVFVDSSSDEAVASATPVGTGEPAAINDTPGGEEVNRHGDRLAIEEIQEAVKQQQAAEKKRLEIEAAQQDPRRVARAMLSDYGWGEAQYSCLDQLWVGESGWDHTATNPSSGAYGIPQSLPADKMATAGDDWKTNPITQIRWGLDYIVQSYGTPCSANNFKSGNGWY